MEQREPFRFLSKQEFEKLSQEQKMAYLLGASAELKRRGDELKKITAHDLDGPAS